MTTERQQAQAVRDTFAQNLRRIRVARKLSQEDLSRLTEMHRTEISVLERGRREPRLRTLIKLSAALKVPLSEFVAGIEWSPLVLASKVEAMGNFHVVPLRKCEE